ncbi:hypothetical protein [Nocardia crassostreae]|uniref:hypothetical protein n=1 Tax=Nocardia crassostreae TaxID=53428 RepID=UPI000835F469|nr:hypothetical protein [Nocardia crassostreae]
MVDTGGDQVGEVAAGDHGATAGNGIAHGEDAIGGQGLLVVAAGGQVDGDATADQQPAQQGVVTVTAEHGTAFGGQDGIGPAVDLGQRQTGGTQVVEEDRTLRR